MIGLLKGGKGVLSGGSYTGEDLLYAVNQYRKSKNLKKLEINEILCDNLVSRWKSIKDGKQHEGFEEWVKNEKILERGYRELAELYAIAPSPSQAIDIWLNSPGHKIQLENKKWEDGCAYANEGITVLILGKK